jgi:uncharacterized protein (DUF2225 family)
MHMRCRLCSTIFKKDVPTFLNVRKVAKETWLQLKYYKFTFTPLR